MSKKIIGIITALLVIFFGISAFLLYIRHQGVGETKKTYPQASVSKRYKISELKGNGLKAGDVFNVNGYIAKVYNCPPCKNGASCKPCMGDNIVISEENKLLQTYTLSDKELIIFVDKPNQFKFATNYSFTLKKTDDTSDGKYELVGYSLK